jgi:hypothetical protein
MVGFLLNDLTAEVILQSHIAAHRCSSNLQEPRNMSRNIRLLLGTALLTLVAACASVRPAMRDVAPPGVTAPQGMATLVLARPWHFVDHGHAVAISVNDKLIGRLPNQSYAYYQADSSLKCNSVMRGV